MASGDRYAAAGKLPEAVIEYRNAVEQDPRAGEVRVKLADAYLRVGDPARAVQEYVRGADLLPNETTLHLKVSGLLLLGGRFDDAKVWAEKVLAREPRNVEAQILLANALAGLKDLDAAIAEIEEAIRLNPERGATYSNLGAFELQRGQAKAAEQAFKKAVELDAHSAAAHLALANFYWVSARWGAAEEALRSAVAVESSNPLAHRALANFYIATSRASEAEPHLRKVLELTKAPEAALALADYYTVRKDAASARSVLQPLAQTAGTAAPAEVRLAALDHTGGLRDQAYERLERVLARDKGDLQALLIKSAFLLADGKRDEAFLNANLTVEKHGESPAAYFTLGRVQAARFQPQGAIAAYESALRLNPRATDAKVALAQLQLASGSADASVGLAEETVQAEPANAEAHLVLVRGLLAKRDLPRAESELKVLYARFPDSAAVHVQMGILQALKKDPAGAKKHFDRALELEPGSTEAFGGLVALDLAAKRFSDARARVDGRLAQDGTNASILMIAARVYASTSDAKGAEEILRRVIDLEPAFLGAYAALAQLYVKQGRLDAALAEFEQLAQRDPKPVAALTFAGIVLQAQGKTSEARERFERALQVDPTAAVAANNLAWIYAESGASLDVALQLAQTAFSKLPDTPQVGDTLGFIYYKKDLLPQAIQALKPIVEQDPTNAVYHYHLGLAYAKAGDVAGAKQHLTRAVALKADFDGAAEAKALLNSLGVTK